MSAQKHRGLVEVPPTLPLYSTLVPRVACFSWALERALSRRCWSTEQCSFDLAAGPLRLGDSSGHSLAPRDDDDAPFRRLDDDDDSRLENPGLMIFSIRRFLVLRLVPVPVKHPCRFGRLLDVCGLNMWVDQRTQISPIITLLSHGLSQG